MCTGVRPACIIGRGKACAAFARCLRRPRANLFPIYSRSQSLEVSFPPPHQPPHRPSTHGRGTHLRLVRWVHASPVGADRYPHADHCGRAAGNRAGRVWRSARARGKRGLALRHCGGGRCTGAAPRVGPVAIVSGRAAARTPATATLPTRCQHRTCRRLAAAARAAAGTRTPTPKSGGVDFISRAKICCHICSLQTALVARSAAGSQMRVARGASGAVLTVWGEAGSCELPKLGRNQAEGGSHKQKRIAKAFPHLTRSQPRPKR